jgi:hypothetical protein
MMVYQLHGIFNVKLDVKVVIISEQRAIYEEVGVACVKALYQKHVTENKETH